MGEWCSVCLLPSFAVYSFWAHRSANSADTPLQTQLLPHEKWGAGTQRGALRLLWRQRAADAPVEWYRCLTTMPGLFGNSLDFACVLVNKALTFLI